MSIEEKDSDFEFLKNLGAYESKVPGGLWEEINKGIEKLNLEDADLQQLHALKNHRSNIPDNSWNLVARGLARIAFRKWAFYLLGSVAFIAIGLGIWNNLWNRDNVVAPAKTENHNKKAPSVSETNKSSLSKSSNVESSGVQPNKALSSSEQGTSKAILPAYTQNTSTLRDHSNYAKNTTTLGSSSASTPLNAAATNSNIQTTSQNTGTNSSGNVNVDLNAASSLPPLLILDKRLFKNTLPFFALSNFNAGQKAFCCLMMKPAKKAPARLNYQLYAGGDAALNIPHIGFNFRYQDYWWPGLQEALKQLAQKTSSFNPSAGVQITQGRNMYGLGIMMGEIRIKIDGNFVTNELPNYDSEGAITSISRYPTYYSFKIDAKVNIQNISLPLNYYRNVLGKKNRFYLGTGIIPNYTFSARGSFLQGGSSTEYVDGRGILRKFNADYSAGFLYQKYLSKRMYLQSQMTLSKNIMNMFDPNYKQSATLGFWRPTAGFKLVYNL